MRREKVAVLTRGTLTDPQMLGANPDAVFLMALAELPVPAAMQQHGGGAGVPAWVLAVVQLCLFLSVGRSLRLASLPMWFEQL